ncbi:hypothetical protein PoB_005509300 [Plakobranchus ocellatus]|uniref:Uncharacterized protein n=1 Tax=Plakobranchus ocellatus TaxID=259542 RepID=A0AAV4CC94_9GAST|nr:hypothetical protein PoB_005509300 [Plakobranchus ocellatus]
MGLARSRALHKLDHSLSHDVVEKSGDLAAKAVAYQARGPRFKSHFEPSQFFIASLCPTSTKWYLGLLSPGECKGDEESNGKLSHNSGGSLNGRAADLLEDSTLEQVEDRANRSRSTARRSRAEIDETILLTERLNLPGMNEFVKYLDASYRVKTKCRNGESGFIDIAEPVFSMLPVWKR